MGTALTALIQLEEVSSVVGIGEGTAVGVAGTVVAVADGVGGTAVAVGGIVAVVGMVVAVIGGDVGETAVSPSAAQAVNATIRKT
jgi:hypothetical protein